MLSIRNAEVNDFEDIKAFMKKESLWDDSKSIDFSEHETMLLVDGAMILGFAMATLIDFKPFITGVYIPEKLRNHHLGDAVLRGILFYLNNRGFEHAFAYRNTEFAAFLAKEGFEPSEVGLTLHLETFFNEKCRGCKDAH